VRRPGFAAGVACTFALGIGATTTVYSVVDGVLLRPLPYREPSALVTLGSVRPDAAWMDGRSDLQNLRLINWRNLERFRERTRSLESVGAIMQARLIRLPVDDGWVATRAPAVSSGLFETLGVVPVLGRSFLPEESPAALREVAGYAITPGYLSTAGTTVVQGRGFDRLDGPSAERVVLVNESFVRTELGGADPIDVIVRRRAWRWESDKQVSALLPMRIVGVVDDVVQSRPEEGLRPAIYVPYTQFEEAAFISAAVRTNRPTAATIADLRRVSAWFAPNRQPAIVAMEDRMAATRTSPRFNAMLTVSFALVAVSLAATGLYGAMIHVAWRRRRELGLRMALGASRSGIIKMVMGQGLLLSTAGLVFGSVCTLLSARVVGSFLYEVQPSDPATLVAVGAVQTLVSVGARLHPARRATGIDPATVLKAD
jgi:hypothetical protein